MELMDFRLLFLFTENSADKRAQELLRNELDDYDGRDYNTIITEAAEEEALSGYAHFYLAQISVDLRFGDLTFDDLMDKADVIIELAEVDLEKGTPIEEVIFWCCWYAPIKETIEKLIGLENKENIGETMANVLEYEDDDGFNCLIHCYEMMVSYRNRGKDPSITPIKTSTEETIKFLIDMGLQNDVEIKSVINHVTKNGITLFHRSTSDSKEVASLLMSMQVKVNEINDLFQTVNFQVNLFNSLSVSNFV